MSCLLGSFFLNIVQSVSNSTAQIAMISKVVIKFRSKFQFQIPSQFYRIVEKVDICDGNDQKDHHFPNFPILVTILFFRDCDSSILNIKLL